MSVHARALCRSRLLTVLSQENCPEIEKVGLEDAWRVSSRVAAHLENGSRLENMSWRLWHLQQQGTIVDFEANSQVRFLLFCVQRVVIVKSSF